MIFTACTQCDEPKTIHYECGDGTEGTAERWKCEHCGAINFSERISIDGQTFSEADFWKAHPGARKQ